MQLDLNLDGMLKVSAREKATGLQKQITIENALARYEREELDAARERLDELWGNAFGDEAVRGRGTGRRGPESGPRSVAGAGRRAARGPARDGAGAGAVGEGGAAAGNGAAGGPAGGRAADGEGADGPDRPPVGG